MSSMSESRILAACLFLICLISFTYSRPTVPLISPSISLIQKAPTLELSHTTNLSRPTSDRFPIPRTDLTLRLHQSRTLLSATELNFLLLEASSDIQHRIDQSRADAPYLGLWVKYKSYEGLKLEIRCRVASPEEYVSLGELRDVVSGLSLYMMQGAPPRAVQFQVIQNLGSPGEFIKNVGSIGEDEALPGVLLSKRDVPPVRLVRDSSASSSTRIVNASILSLPTADDFPIPHSDYTLRFGFLGARVHPRDLESLLNAVNAEIEAEMEAHGRLALLSSEEYSKNEAGLQFWIRRMPWSTENLAWAQLAIVLNGLWLYIVDESHDREAFIDVIDHVTGRQIAFGWIGEPHRILEHVPSSGTVRRVIKSLSSRQIP